MRERDAQRVLTIQAFEEADTDSTLLSTHARTRAMRAAVEAVDSLEVEERAAPLVIRRAAELLPVLQDAVPALEGVLRLSRLGFNVAPFVIGLALVAGLLSNVLGPQRHINLLSFPLFALLAWNLVMYVFTGAGAVVRMVRRQGNGKGGERIAGLLLRIALWRGWQIARRGVSSGDSEVLPTGYARYGALWWKHAAPLLTARVRRTLHLGAIAMIGGAVGGMYLRGFAFEYRATWESTLLSAQHVQTLLDFVLRPAALVLGRTVPDVAPLEVPGHGAAAEWLHLYGVTALLLVVIPRTLLWIIESVRAARLARIVDIDLETPYFRRLLAAGRGAQKHVEILPYSFRPRPSAVDMMKSLLYDFFGARADIRVRESLSYGDEPTDVAYTNGDEPHAAADPAAAAKCHVVIFNLAQSPEIEVHGSFLEELKHTLERARGQLLVLIDLAPYQRRVQSPERWQERMRAWDRIVRESGLTAVGVDTAQPVNDALLESLRGALWPDAASEAH